MKICTLIVRLVGLVLLVQSTIAFIELKSMRGAMKVKFGATLSVNGMDVGGQMTRMQVYIVIGILTGLLCCAFAPFVARLLTFDAPADSPTESCTAPNVSPATQLDKSGATEGPLPVN